MYNSSIVSSRSDSSDSTSSYVYSPLPVRTPHILGLSMKFFSTEDLNELDSLHCKSNKHIPPTNQPNQLINKKFLDLAKEDIESEARIEFFPRKDNAQEGLITEQFYEYFEEQYEPLDLILPVRASNPHIYDKQFTCGADEGIMSFQSEILGVEIDP